MECILYASKNQMFKAFGIPTSDGLTVACPVWVNTEAGMRFNLFKKRYEPNPITVQHQIILWPTTNKNEPDDVLVTWRCEYKVDCAARWAEQRLELFANVNRSVERKKKGRTKPGNKVYTKDGARTKPVKTKSAIAKWHKRATKNRTKTVKETYTLGGLEFTTTTIEVKEPRRYGLVKSS